MVEHIPHRPWALIAGAACLVAALVACRAAAGGETEPQGASPAARLNATPADDPAETDQTQKPQPPGAETPEQPKGQKTMRLEDIKDLPILKRYELPLEKGDALLADVNDNTFGYDESAFWWVVHQVAGMPVEAFQPDKVTTGYAQLLAMPSAYRGKPVTIRGAYMTCAPFETPVLAIRKDVPTLYECNIRELPLEEERPVATVIVTKDPMAYLRVWDVVKVRGYFYKVRRYKGSKGEGLAPMVVAQRLVPEGPTRQGPSSTVDMGSTTILLVLMIAAIVLLGVAYVFLRYKTKATPHAAHQGTGHRFQLRRPDRDEPAGDGGPGSEGGQPES